MQGVLLPCKHINTLNQIRGKALRLKDEYAQNKLVV